MAGLCFACRFIHFRRRLSFDGGPSGVQHKLLDHVCGHRLQIVPVCRFPVTQRDDLEPIAGRGIAAANGGAVKS